MLFGRRAFTLVELLVVVSIILILVGIAIPAVNIARTRAKNTEVKGNLIQIQQALEQHAVDNEGSYPGAHWVQDSAGDFYVGPGVIGALPTYDGATPRKDFHVPSMESTTADAVGPLNETALMADRTPNPNVVDALVADGYLTQYPANPFIQTTGSARAQMSNLFLFNPVLGDTTPLPDLNHRYTLDWNRYTDDTTADSTRSDYVDISRGHFSYIPLNPINHSGTDWSGFYTGNMQWTGNYSDYDRSEYYNRCRGYILLGWGADRMEDTMSKGVSEKYWYTHPTTNVSWFDFDQSLSMCEMESVLSDASAGSLVYQEMRDSAGSVGSFGAMVPGAGPNIDSLFYGAVVFKIAGS